MTAKAAPVEKQRQPRHGLGEAIQAVSSDFAGETELSRPQVRQDCSVLPAPDLVLAGACGMIIRARVREDLPASCGIQRISAWRASLIQN